MQDSGIILVNIIRQLDLLHIFVRYPDLLSKGFSKGFGGIDDQGIMLDRFFNGRIQNRTAKPSYDLNLVYCLRPGGDRKLAYRCSNNTGSFRNAYQAFPARYSFIAAAAILPWPIARITGAAPKTISPPA